MCDTRHTIVSDEKRTMRRTPLVAALLSTALVVPLGLLSPTASAAEQPGTNPEARANRAPELSTGSRLADRRSLVVGSRFYEMGAEDGSYPATGFHTRGEMGGFWSMPIKLLDGVWFKVGRHLADRVEVHQRLGLPADGARHPRRRADHPDRRRAERAAGRADRAPVLLVDREDRAPGRRRPLRADELLPVGQGHRPGARPDRLQPARTRAPSTATTWSSPRPGRRRSPTPSRTTGPPSSGRR